MNLKKITINSLFWSFIEKFINQGIYLITSIILARLLSPSEFGVVALMAIILSISEVLINGGFSDALIRRKDATNDDYSTIFIFNIIISVLLYILIYALANNISSFLDLSSTDSRYFMRVYGVIILINSLGFVRMTILRKELQFKKITLVLSISGVISGIIAIIMAVNGFGIWSLIVKGIVNSCVQLLLLLAFVKRKISFKFNVNSFISMFSFSANIVSYQILNTIFSNIYIFAIGNFYGPIKLGYYNVAKRFGDAPTKNLNTIVQNVTYPLLSKIQQSDVNSLLPRYKKIYKYTLCCNIIFSALLFSMSDELISLLLGSKWMESGEIFEILILSAVFIPSISLSSNILKVLGRSRIILNLTIISKVIVLMIVVCGYYFGFKTMLRLFVIEFILYFLLFSYFSGRELGYPIRLQILDILPISIIGIALGILSRIIEISTDNQLLLVGIKLIIGLSLFLLVLWMFYSSLLKEFLKILKRDL